MCEFHLGIYGNSSSIFFFSDSFFGSVDFLEDDGGSDFIFRKLLLLLASLRWYFFAQVFLGNTGKGSLNFEEIFKTFRSKQIQK